MAMRWTLAKAGLALFTAGTMGIARPGQAQTSSYLPLGAPARTNSSHDDGHSAGKRQAAPEEMRIELAWMADPATFPCLLGAYRDGNALKVRGFVPTEAVRARALQIAGEQSGMAVVDELRIYANVPMRAVGVRVDDVLYEAAAALAQAMGEKANPLKLTATADGEVVVAGSLSSLADKLAVSRSLWAVHGCTSVRNKVTVSGYADYLPVAAKTTAPQATESKGTDPKSKPPAVAKSDRALPKVVTLPEEQTEPAVTTTNPSRLKTAKETKRDAMQSPPAVLPAEGTDTAHETFTLPSVTKPVSAGGKTVVLPPSESKPRVAPLSGSADAWSGHRVVTLPEHMNPSVTPLSESGDPKVRDWKAATPSEGKSSPADTAKNQPVPSGGVPIVVDHTPKTKADGAGVARAEARSTDKPSNKVEPVGSRSAPPAKTPAPAEAPYVSPGVISYEDGLTAPSPAHRGCCLPTRRWPGCRRPRSRRSWWCWSVSTSKASRSC